MGRLVKNPHLARNAGIASAGLMPGGTTAERPTSGVEDGYMRYNESNSAMEYTTDGGSTWTQVSKTGSTAIVVDKIAGADGILVAFTMSQSVPADDPKSILVFVGGVHQIETTNYTVSGTTITFTSAPPNLESITVLHNFNLVT